MEYILAQKNDLQIVFDIVQKTIKYIYPKYYPQEVVKFFCELHNLESIEKDICGGSVGLLKDGEHFIGTGCYIENHITRVYVLPEFQGKGYGTYIMNCLEEKISEIYKKAYLDASLPASHLYEKRGYVTIEHRKWEVDNGVILVYEVMEKEL
ncbi:MAG: GNAT family N-acetyltransferase [Lachnospiraceae bacterium]|nr:GNAT family N-acetyltransferase [Lachnospiraceae bacterium]